MSAFDDYFTDNPFEDSIFNQFTPFDLCQFSTNNLVSVMAAGKPCILPLTDPDQQVKKAVDSLNTLELKHSKNWRDVSKDWLARIRREVGQEPEDDDGMADLDDDYLKVLDNAAEIWYRQMTISKMNKMTPAETLAKAAQAFEARGQRARAVFFVRVAERCDALCITEEDVRILKKISPSTPEPALNDLYSQFVASLFGTQNLSSEVLQLVSHLLGLTTLPSPGDLVDIIYQGYTQEWRPTNRHMEVMSYVCTDPLVYLAQPSTVLKLLYQQLQIPTPIKNQALWLVLPNV
jgi:hypothetical protein